MHTLETAVGKNYGKTFFVALGVGLQRAMNGIDTLETTTDQRRMVRQEKHILAQTMLTGESPQ